MTRTLAATAAATYDRKIVDMMVADGFATAFPLRDGTTNYVVKLDGRTFAIKAHQIVDYPEAAFTILVDGAEFDDNAAEAALADAEAVQGPFQHYLVEAEAAGISVGELTDGEYEVDTDGVVVSAEEAYRDALEHKAERRSKLQQFDDVLADFGL